MLFLTAPTRQDPGMSVSCAREGLLSKMLVFDDPYGPMGCLVNLLCNVIQEQSIQQKQVD